MTNLIMKVEKNKASIRGASLLKNKTKLEKNERSRKGSEVTGVFVFSHIRIMGYFRLG